MSDPLVHVSDLKKHYYEQDTLLDRALGNDPVAVRAVDGVSFDIHEGETLGLVGESGCGKSTLGEALVNLETPTTGDVMFDNLPVYDLDEEQEREFRRRVQVVFQDPYSSLNPRMTVGETIREPMALHDMGTKAERKETARELLEQVGLDADHTERYPHEFSGGQRQRIGIARALGVEPDFIVLDEPVSALDVSVQAQILTLLNDLQTEYDLTYLLITHDLSIVRRISDRIAVMYLGKFAEIGPTEEIFENPQHPYTEGLLENVPRANVEEQYRDIQIIAGDVPSPRDPPSGCRFRTRCPEIIQPAAFDLNQDHWRAIVDLKTQLENGSLSTDWLVSQAANKRDDQSLEQQLRDLLELPSTVEDDTADAILNRVLSALADERPGDALGILETEFESLCERESPALEETEPNRCTACHLYQEDPD